MIQNPAIFKGKLKLPTPLKTQAIFINSTEFQNSTIFHQKLKDICSKLNISGTKYSHVAGKTTKKQPWASEAVLSVILCKKIN